MSDLVVVYGLVVAACFGTSDFLSKGLLEEIGLFRTTVYTLGLSGAFVLLPSLALGVKPVDLAGAAVLALIACTSFLGFFLMYRGYSKGNLSVVSPTVNTFPVYSVAFSVLVLRVAISEGVLLALAGVIVGILLVSTKLSSLLGGGGRLTPGVPEALVSALFFAAAFTLIGYADETIGYGLPVVSARLGGFAVGLLAGAATGRRPTPFGGAALRRVTAMAVLEAGALMSFNLALIAATTIGGLPIVTTLAGMGVVFTVGLAKVVRKEPIELNHGVGIAVLVASVAALLYLTG